VSGRMIYISGRSGVKWMGVDVGGERKGFDVAVIDSRELLVLHGRLDCTEVLEIVEAIKPLVVGIDSPCRCAPPGGTSRPCERELAKKVCGIRWTPDAPAVETSPYYGWVVQGLRLYAALVPVDTEVIEVFPTASWTRWLGKRGPRRRSAWTTEGLRTLGLGAVPDRTNQDQRDAIAAAVTARQHSQAMTESFGEIVVPR
jgi:predicted nuclease with RNAse H fold